MEQVGRRIGLGDGRAVDHPETFQPVPGAAQGDPDPPAPPVGGPPEQGIDDPEGRQVAGAVVEGLTGQRVRPVGAEHPGSRGGDARGRLHEAVEAPSGRPRPDGPVGRQVDEHQARTLGRQCLGAEADGSQCARAVAVDDHVGLPHQGEEAVPIRGLTEVEQAGPLARARLDDQQVDLGQVGAVDLEDLRSVGGQEPPGHRSGDDPGQVEDPDARQRTLTGRLGGLGRRGPDLLDVQEREPGERLALGVSQPGVGRPLHRSAQAGGGQRVLQGLGLPRGCGRGDRFPVRRRDAQHGEAARLVVREVGVDLHPTVVARAVGPRNRPPRRRRYLAGEPEVALGAEGHGGMAPIDTDRLFPAGAPAVERSHGGGRRGHGLRRDLGHPVGGRVELVGSLEAQLDPVLDREGRARRIGRRVRERAAHQGLTIRRRPRPGPGPRRRRPRLRPEGWPSARGRPGRPSAPRRARPCAGAAAGRRP